MEMSISRNIALASLRRLRRSGSSSPRRSAASRRTGQRLQLKYGRLSNPANSLSGGNQQKVVLAKWLGRRPSLLLVDEPTRGIDIGTKAEVHRLLDELAGQGVAILMISSELPEVLRVADRILVMREGRLVAELAHHEASEETIVAAATGQVAGGGLMATVDRATSRSRPAESAPTADRPRLPAARLRDRRRARPADHRDRDGAAVPQRPGGQHRPRQLDDPRAPHARRGDGHHHAERRPVDRLRARPVRLRVGEDVRPPARGVDRPRSSSRSSSASAWACLRHRQRRADDDRADPEPRGHAGDALHHPRDRDPDHRRRSGRRQLAAGRVLPDLAEELPQRPVPRGRGRRGDRDRRLLHALVPLGPRPVRDRVAPRRGAARRDPRRAAGVHRLRRERGDGRRRRRALGVEVRHARLHRRDRATSSR